MVKNRFLFLIITGFSLVFSIKSDYFSFLSKELCVIIGVVLFLYMTLYFISSFWAFLRSGASFVCSAFLLTCVGGAVFPDTFNFEELQGVFEKLLPNKSDNFMNASYKVDFETKENGNLFNY